jgi:Rossmann-like domain.
LNAEIDLLIIAVSDQSIATVIQQVKAYLPQVLIVHTSGSTNITVLTQQHSRAGVFYPLQTFSLDRDVDWTLTPIFVEAAIYRFDDTYRFSKQH